MLNFIIAIMALTYEIFNEKAKGLYYDSLIGSFPLYENHDVWGFVTTAHIPFDYVLLIQAPVMWFLERFKLMNKKGLKILNTLFSSFHYIPAALITISFFIAGSLIVMPFSFIIHLGRLTSVMFESENSQQF